LNHSLLDDEALDIIYYISPSPSPLKLLTASYDFIVNPLAAFNVSVMKYFFSDSEAVVRLPNLIIGLIAFPFLYHFTKKYFGPKESLLVIFILVFSFSHILFSTNIRGYSIVITATVILLFVTMQLAEKNSTLLWLSISMLLIFNAYNHLATFPLFAVVTFFLTVVFLKDHFTKNLRLINTVYRLTFLSASLFFALACVIYIYDYKGVPLGKLLLMKMTGFNLQEANENKLFGSISLGGTKTSHLTYKFIYKMITDFSLGDRFPTYVQFALFLIGVCAAWKKNFNATLLLSLTFVIPLILEAQYKVFFFVKYFSYFLIPYWVFMAVAGVFLFDYLKMKSRDKLSELNQNVVLTGFICFFAWSYFPLNVWFGSNLTSEIYSRLTNSYRDTKSAAKYIKKHLKERDIIINLSNSAIPPDGGLARYYLNDYAKAHMLQNVFYHSDNGDKVRVWFLGVLNENKSIPYYLPDNFNPRIVSKFKGVNIYLDENVTIWADNLKEDLDKSSPFWLFLKGRYYLQRKRYGYARSYLEKFIKIPNIPNIRRAYNNLAIVSLGFGNKDLAIKYFNNALLSEPASESKAFKRELSAPFFNLGVLHCKNAIKDGSIVNEKLYEVGKEYIRKGFSMSDRHPNRDLLVNALNGEIIDFNQVEYIVNALINHKSF